MPLGFATDTWNVLLNALNTRMNSGSGPAYLEFYNGAQPATGGTVTTLQATVDMADPAGTLVGAVLTITGGTEGTRVGIDTITWARMYTSDAAFIMDCSVGITGGGANIELDDLGGYAGGLVKLMGGTFVGP